MSILLLLVFPHNWEPYIHKGFSTELCSRTYYSRLRGDRSLISQWRLLAFSLRCILSALKCRRHVSFLSRCTPRYVTLFACGSRLLFNVSGTCAEGERSNDKTADLGPWSGAVRRWQELTIPGANRQDQSRYQSEHSVNQINYKGAATSRVVKKAAPWEPTGSARHSVLGYQESSNGDAGSRGPEGITRLGQGRLFIQARREIGRSVRSQVELHVDEIHSWWTK